MTTEDLARLHFLEALARSNVVLTEWEADFVDSVVCDCRPMGTHIAYTPRQREKIDQLEKRYRREL